MALSRGAGLLALPAVALLLLGAHFVHAGLRPPAALCVAALSLLFVRQRWAARVLQAILGIGVVVWVLTAATLAQIRMAYGQPYLRMLVILGVVAAFTLVAALVLQHPALARRFGIDRAADHS